MKIKFLEPRIYEGNVKCTIHTSGKLGFSNNAINILGINTSSYIKIGINEEEKSDQSLYMMIINQQDGQAFKVNKAGNYYYLNTKFLFDEQNVEYKKKKIIYDIQELKNNENKLFKLNRRELERKRK